MNFLKEVLKQVSINAGRRVTQKEIAEAIGKSQAYLNSLALNKSQGSPYLWAEIAEYLSGVDPETDWTIGDLFKDGGSNINIGGGVSNVNGNITIGLSTTEQYLAEKIKDLENTILMQGLEILRLQNLMGEREGE